jgi:hypothetical protein
MAWFVYIAKRANNRGIYLKKWLPEWYLDHCKKLKVGHTAHTSIFSLTPYSLHDVVVLAATSSSTTLFSNDHNLNLPPLSSCFILMDFSVDSTQPGKTFYASDTHNTSWIFDYGSIDHMTYDKSLFRTEKPHFYKCVVTANDD